MSEAIRELEKTTSNHAERLIRIETEVLGMHKEMGDLRQEVQKNGEEGRQMATRQATILEKIGELNGAQRLIVKILFAGFGGFAGLEIYVRFFGG